ncbi:hypothetical protein K491DRAFT_87296 [Lophiostoma macrostomum CBS 122681]|uniref:PD-(D/E)XK nuclease-like domain-containing protein n=1 Tax=Lophiostoma macrostomum CBS 122681 TaxID=1314788 RepID=A0A6A6SV64_9PLEO|nr:hypothetical protein K491DRAFT_87296 [Lophiostoma macrostomum CBS 122681]
MAQNTTADPTLQAVSEGGLHISASEDHPKVPIADMTGNPKVKSVDRYIWRDDLETPSCLFGVTEELQKWEGGRGLMPSSVKDLTVEISFPCGIWYASPSESEDALEHERATHIALQKLSLAWALFKDALYHLQAAVGSLHVEAWEQATKKCQADGLAPYCLDNTLLAARLWPLNYGILRDIEYLADIRRAVSRTKKRDQYGHRTQDHSTVSFFASAHTQETLQSTYLETRRGKMIQELEKSNQLVRDTIERGVRELCVDQKAWAGEFERGVSVELFYDLLQLAMRERETGTLKITGEQVREAYAHVNPYTKRPRLVDPISFTITLRSSSIPESLSSKGRFANPSCNESISQFPFAILVDTAHNKDDDSKAIGRLKGWATACFDHYRATVPSLKPLPLPLVLLTARGTLDLYLVQDMETHCTISLWRKVNNAGHMNGWYHKLAVFRCLGQWVENTYRPWLEEYAREYAARVDTGLSADF